MDAAMEKLWRKFHLSEEEKGVLALSSQEMALSKDHAQFSILFKLQSTKDFNKKAFKSTIQKLWHGLREITIKEVGSNLFLAVFVREGDMIEVLDKSPWSFDRKLILLKHFHEDLSLRNLSFQYSPFWIRVLNIPIKSMNKVVTGCYY